MKSDINIYSFDANDPDLECLGKLYVLAFIGEHYASDDKHNAMLNIEKHAHYEGFKGLKAKDANGEVIGFAYGYSSLPGQFYREKIAAQLTDAQLSYWLADCFEFVELAVSSSHQRLGIASRLHDTLLDDIGYKTSILTTWMHNHPAIHLYENKGWELIKEEAPVITRDNPQVIMGKAVQDYEQCKQQEEITVNRLAVFCGSSIGASDAYQKGAVQLGLELAERDITLVYGGSNIGMMHVLANTVLENGGEVIGVIPELLVDREVAHPDLSTLHVVSSMHERKAKMADLADGFIALPGGPGTLEEFMEVFTWAKMGIHQKPCGLLNINHYYDPLVSLFDHMVDQQFLSESDRALTFVDESPGKLIQSFYERW